MCQVPTDQGIEEHSRSHDMKWINSQRVDKIRICLEVREIKARKTTSDKLDPLVLFPAMPPVESVKAWISLLQTEHVKEDTASVWQDTW